MKIRSYIAAWLFVFSYLFSLPFSVQAAIQPMTTNLPFVKYSPKSIRTKEASLPAKTELEIAKVIKEALNQDEEKANNEQDIQILKEFTTDTNNPFHIPEGLKNNVKFWTDIYAKYKTNEVIIHDNRHLDIIYTVLKISDNLDTTGAKYRSKSIRKLIKSEKRKFSKILKSIHYKSRKKQTLTEEEKRVEKLLKPLHGKKKYLDASKRIRSQLGLRDRFLVGIKRSGKYLKDMEQIFRKFDLPIELTALPHVESSFNYEAYSSAGAVGVWQFMRSTGRLFMQVDYVVDERRDPVASTIAAAKLLKRNYKALGNWPMAIIAYNHGLSGIKRAKKRMGNGVVDVINGYKSRLFGFASKNFYSEFLAALDIHQNTEKYFGQVRRHPSAEYGSLPIQNFVHIKNISKYMNLDMETLKKFNPALRKPVIQGEKLIPKGYTLKYPLPKNNNMAELYAKIPASQLKKKQIRSDWYRVRRGDSLYTVARRNKTTISALLALNDIRNPKRIYSGQVLKLPSVSNKKQTAVMSKRKKVPKKNRTSSAPYKRRKLALTKDTSFKKIYEVLSPSPANAENLEYAYIKVAPDETMGHYADWSGIGLTQIKRLNNIRRGKPIVIGQTIKIPLAKISEKKFGHRREEYLRGLQEDFFATYKIDSTEKLVVERGDSLWKICMENDIPFWVLNRYNPEKNLHRLDAGDVLNMPTISKIN